jgi:Flp pilus assembly protein TadB
MRDIGFTLVALWAAFVIILVLDLGAPIWLVLLSAVLAIAIGHRFIRSVEARRNVERPAS